MFQRVQHGIFRRGKEWCDSEQAQVVAKTRFGKCGNELHSIANKVPLS